MKAYCERQGLTMRHIRFRYGGEAFYDTDTPAQLQMEDEEVIDVFRAFPYPMSLTNQNSEHINLKVVGPDGPVQFKLNLWTPLSKLMKAYCDRQGLTMRHIRFRYGGEAFNDTDTPAQLQMEDEDEIDVFRAFPYPMIIPRQRQGNLSE
ncbi:small ubiquitin-related modifier 2-A-like [Engraulis encrasicolus]|uniref:small ubiquitin-related modifier 2-A-like n=1 Tax=Engraulis encrasicolus TaxID=184585 RepID=UPI002FD39908